MQTYCSDSDNDRQLQRLEKYDKWDVQSTLPQFFILFSTDSNKFERIYFDCFPHYYQNMSLVFGFELA